MLMKKFTLFFMSLFFAMTAWAAATDLPEMSTEGNIKWYTIKNVRQQKYATYAGENATMTQQETISGASLFYFTASTTEGAVKIHNYSAGDKLCAGYNSWNADGIDWYLKAQSTGVSICTSTGEWDAWNDAGGGGQKVEYWSAGDAGSAWEIELVTDFTAAIDVPAAKEAAIAELNNLATVSVIYPEATEAVAAIEAVTAADNTIAGLNVAIEAVNKIVADYKTAAYKELSGKYYTINTPARPNGYLQMTASKVVGTAAATTPANLWQFVENNGAVNIYNPYTGLYLCEPKGNSENVAVTADKSAAGAYQLEVVTKDSGDDGAIVKIAKEGKGIHMAGHYDLVRWDNGDASEWNISSIDDNTIATVVTEFISTVKAAAVAEVEGLAQIKNLFPAKDEYVTRINNVVAESTVAGCKEATNAINAVIADYTKNVDGKNVRLTSYGRDNANGHDLVIDANGGYGKTNAGDAGIWTLKAAGTQVKLYNFIADLWLGKTAGTSMRVPAVHTEAEAMTYTFSYSTSSTEDSIIVNLINAGNTLHLAGDKTVVQWNDNAAPASQFLVNTEAAIVPTRELYVAANNSAAKLPYEIQKAYGLVKDAANYYSNHKEPKEGSYEALLDNNAGTIFHSTWSDSTALAETHYIQADFGEGNTVGGFYFYMAPRSNGKNFPVKMTVSGSNNNEDFETIAQVEETTGLSTVIGDDTKQYQYIRLTVDSTNTGTKFFALSELYFFPATEEVTALINKRDNFAEAGITEAGYENLANTLVNAEVALSLSNSQADAETFISSIDHAKVPALGQYPTAAYNKLVAAVEKATKAADVEAAINTFKLTLNRPVYLIKCAWEKNGEADAYTKGGAILFDGKWKWAAADKTNKQMWMTFPGLTTTELPIVDAYNAEGTSYEICDYLTGTLMRGKMVQIVKIADWENAYNLQYNADATSTDAAHHAQSDGKALVNWKPATATDCQASAWTFEYVGNSYDLRPFEVESVTPAANEEVEKLETITIEFTKDIVVDWGTDNSGTGTGTGTGTGGTGTGTDGTGTGTGGTGTGTGGTGTGTGTGVQSIKVKDANNGNAATIWTSQAKVEGNKLIMVVSSAITKGGKYTVEFPAGVVKSTNDETYDGATFEFNVSEKLAYVSNSYSKDSEKVETLETFTVEFSNEIASVAEMTLEVKLNNNVVTTVDTKDATINGNTVEFTLAEAQTVGGTYKVNLPAGLVTDVDGKALYEAKNINLKVTYKMSVVAVTPEADQAVEALETITIEFNDGIYLFPATLDIVDANGAKVATANVTKNEKIATLTLDNAITTSGVYSLTIAADVVMSLNSAYYAGGTFTFTVEADETETNIENVIVDGDAVIYDLSGRRVEKITERGIYIVNGKKVIK